MQKFDSLKPHNKKGYEKQGEVLDEASNDKIHIGIKFERNESNSSKMEIHSQINKLS